MSVILQNFVMPQPNFFINVFLLAKLCVKKRTLNKSVFQWYKKTLKVEIWSCLVIDIKRIIPEWVSFCCNHRDTILCAYGYYITKVDKGLIYHFSLLLCSNFHSAILLSDGESYPGFKNPFTWARESEWAVSGFLFSIHIMYKD